MEASGFHDIFHKYFNGLHVEQEQKMHVSKPIGEGEIQRWTSLSGMEIVLSDYQFHTNHRIHFSSDAAMVELNFCIQGSGEVHISNSSYNLKTGNCYLYFMKDFEVLFEYEKQNPMYSLAIGIPVPLFNHFMGNVVHPKILDFHSVIGDRSFKKFRDPIDPMTVHIIKQIIARPHSHRIHQLDIESKALELLSIYFGRFLLNDNHQKRNGQLSKSDLEKIRRAEGILIERMEAPPSLLELSKSVGLNDYKLKIGFKELFGTSAFAYLREKRMERAMDLLRAGNSNVSEAASAVGYTNLSHFSELFRKRYGMNPSEFLRIY
ncbi:AraC family transcriptional regulator [Bacillus sp. XF8]|uniref:helix-turn-helix transcriptional regulator n=1 Tax=Bacillus sp. XF8 TaxID=2819289 RepID=UPI001AA03DDC|nr:AraC family transcriptional regulator [Bacillus sp. XF8]MBO1580749.1 helix-turn-helix transcriptional regulator [Bacillus sp. XF8]